MWRELNIPNVFTMEASFCGASIGELADQHFQMEHFQQAGIAVLQALLVYCKIDIEKKILEIKNSAKKNKNEGPSIIDTKPVFTKLADFKIDSITQELAGNKKLIALTAGDEDESGDEGSDSEPSEDNLEEEELAKIVPIATKVKPEPPKKEEPPPKVSTAKSKKIEPPKRPSVKNYLTEDKP